MQATFYAIRLRGTDRYLPPGAYRTVAEPTDTKPPRLFHREVDAKKALTWHANGIAHRDEDGRFSVADGANRLVRDFEIVPVRVVANP